VKSVLSVSDTECTNSGHVIDEVRGKGQKAMTMEEER
jgi:hypothetical protein